MLFFRNGVSNLPKLKKLSSDHLNSAASIEAAEAKETLRKALKDGDTDIITIAKKNISSLSKAAKDQIDKVGKMMPEDININGKIIFLKLSSMFVCKFNFSIHITN